MWDNMCRAVVDVVSQTKWAVWFTEIVYVSLEDGLLAPEQTGMQEKGLADVGILGRLRAQVTLEQEVETGLYDLLRRSLLIALLEIDKDFEVSRYDRKAWIKEIVVFLMAKRAEGDRVVLVSWRLEGYQPWLLDTLDHAVQDDSNEDRTNEVFLLMAGQHSTGVAPPCQQPLSFINSVIICLVVGENASATAVTVEIELRAQFQGTGSLATTSIYLRFSVAL
jgi:hypothetical protein